MPHIISARQIAISNANNPFTGPGPETLSSRTSSATSVLDLSVLMTCFISFLLWPGPIRFVKFTGINRNGIVNRALT
ncbi:unnamed protein product [Tenebrio molitor]|nr:unnamed protein product [Tenebrio molitor]